MLNNFREIKISKSFQIFSLLFALITSSKIAAQDYPYDDAPSGKKNEDGVPVESPSTNTKVADPTSKPTKKYHALFRYGLKVGGNYAIFQQASFSDSNFTDQYSGLGFEGALGMGWDIPYSPTFVELEIGYRGILQTGNNEALQAIPLSFGYHYRSRIGRSSQWKPGIKSSLEARFTRDLINGGTDFSMNPTLSLSSLLEVDSFLIEPMMTIARIQSQYNFLIFHLRVGLRF